MAKANRCLEYIIIWAKGMGNRCCSNKGQLQVTEVVIEIEPQGQIKYKRTEKIKESSTDVRKTQTNNDNLQSKRSPEFIKINEFFTQFQNKNDSPSQSGPSRKNSNIWIAQTSDPRLNLSKWIKVEDNHYQFGQDYDLKGNFTKGIDGFEGKGQYFSPELTFKGIFKMSQPYAGLFIFKQGTKVELKSPFYGKINWSNNRKYKGDLLNMKPNGKGRMRMENQAQYVGQFLNGQIHGAGTYKWKNGASFTGHYINGKKEGKGVYKDPQNGEIEGTWESGSLIKINSSSMLRLRTDSSGPMTPKVNRCTSYIQIPKRVQTPRQTTSLENILQINEQSPLKKNPNRFPECPERQQSPL